MRDSLETELVLAALHVALGSRPRRTLHHSDRGSQYASHAYRDAARRRGITVSMSRVGNCWDNAPVESFFSSLKAELVSAAVWRAPHEAETAVADYLRFYNHHACTQRSGTKVPRNTKPHLKSPYDSVNRVHENGTRPTLVWLLVTGIWLLEYRA